MPETAFLITAFATLFVVIDPPAVAAIFVTRAVQEAVFDFGRGVPI